MSDDKRLGTWQWNGQVKGYLIYLQQQLCIGKSDIVGAPCYFESHGY